MEVASPKWARKQASFFSYHLDHLPSISIIFVTHWLTNAISPLTSRSPRCPKPLQRKEALSVPCDHPTASHVVVEMKLHCNTCMCVSSMSSVSVFCLAFVNKCVMIVALVITVCKLFGFLHRAMVVILEVNVRPLVLHGHHFHFQKSHWSLPQHSLVVWPNWIKSNQINLIFIVPRHNKAILEHFTCRTGPPKRKH